MGRISGENWMDMQPLEESRYEEWDRFVTRANGTVFHYSWWYRSWGARFRINVRRGENGEIEAGMPVYISNYKRMPKIFGVKGLTRPPLTLVNGPLFLRPAGADGNCANARSREETLNAINALPEAGFYDIFLGRSKSDLSPYMLNGFDAQVYYTYVIPKEDAPAWRGGMSSGARHNLKAGHREAGALGCRVETDAAMDEVSPLFFESAESNGYTMKRVPHLLPGWWKAVREKGAGRIYALRDPSGRVLCASLAVWDARTSYFMVGGMHGDARKGHLNMLLFERMIEDALGMGLDFDFEGSTIRGVEKFFRGWGGKLHPCFRVTKAPSLLTYLGLKGYRYFKFHRNRRWVSPC